MAESVREYNAIAFVLDGVVWGIINRAFNGSRRLGSLPCVALRIECSRVENSIIQQTVEAFARKYITPGIPRDPLRNREGEYQKIGGARPPIFW